MKQSLPKWTAVYKFVTWYVQQKCCKQSIEPSIEEHESSVKMQRFGPGMQEWAMGYELWARAMDYEIWSLTKYIII